MILLSRTQCNAFAIARISSWGSTMAKKDPFPNEWEEVNGLSDSDIEACPFIEILQDSVVWDLPDPYCCVVRAYNRKHSKVTEYAYKREGVARQKIAQLAEQGIEVLVLTQQYVATLNYPDD